jgi:glucokinase
VLNDAQAALVGEAWCGAARGVEHAILLTLGTGVGGAALVDGRILRGRLGRAGHLGHVSLDPSGPLDIVHTPGSLEDAVGDCTVARRTGGRFQDTASLVRAASAGDRDARDAWATSVRNLAAAIASLVNVLDPEVVVIGGGIARAGAALFVPLRREVARFEWRPGGQRVRIVPARLGGRAGAFGAARHAMTLAGSATTWI